MIAEIIARLQAQVTSLKVVSGVADFSTAALNKPMATPAAFVLLASESAEDNQLLGAFDQRISVVFTVILALSNRRDPTGAAAMDDLEALRTAIKSALLAWCPTPANGEPVRFGSGQLLRFDDGLLWWADEFRVTTYLRMP